MSISVTCECGRHFETSEENAGRRAQCPDCGRVFNVPTPAPPAEVVFIASEPEPRATSGKAIGSLALGALFFFACLSGVPAILLGRHALSDIRESGGRLGGRRIATAGIVLGVIGCLFTASLLLPAVRSAREAARRAQCVNNLKQIGMAFQYYHESNEYLPPAAITDKNGRPLLSWRVAILPYIDPSSLYSRFHLDEPWDSPHNLLLVNEMPSFYACPSDRAPKAGMTGYLAVVGPDTAFTPDFKPLSFKDFTDGLSSTILFGESRRHVPWTKPEDLPFDMNVPFSGLGSDHGYHSNGFNAVLADGSVRFLHDTTSRSTFRALLTRNQHEVPSPSDY